jgi:hypothetical protein
MIINDTGKKSDERWVVKGGVGQVVAQIFNLKLEITSHLLLVICRSRPLPQKGAPQDSVTLSTKQFHEVAP